MRKTIRRGVLITALTACAFGFGFAQASADTVPGVPELPLSNLATPLSSLGSGVSVIPNLPALPSGPRADLPVGPPSVNSVDIAGLPGKKPELPGVNVMPNIDGNNLGGVNPPSLHDVTSGKALAGDVTKTLPVLSTTQLLPALPGL